MSTKRRVNLFLIISILLVVILVVIMFYYFALRSPDYSSLYESRIKSGELVNPIEGKSIEEAIADFDETFVHYLLYTIKAYNLHNPPLSSDIPKIEVYVEDEIYNAKIIKGDIIVKRGAIDEEDISITTSREEAVNMIKTKNYVIESFKNKKSNIELKAEKSILFAKGYLNLYNEITGESVTGNVIEVYTN